MTQTPLNIGMPASGTDRTVRPALPSDAEAIARLQYAALQQILTEELLPPSQEIQVQWEATLAQPAPQGCATLVAIHGTQVAGFALALPGKPIDEIPRKRPAIPAGTEIAALEVAPDFQRSGHASRLLSAVKDTVGVNNLRIWVADADEARQRLVQSAGFAPAGVRRRLGEGEHAVTEHLWWAEI